MCLHQSTASVGLATNCSPPMPADNCMPVPGSSSQPSEQGSCWPGWQPQVAKEIASLSHALRRRAGPRRCAPDPIQRHTNATKFVQMPMPSQVSCRPWTLRAAPPCGRCRCCSSRSLRRGSRSCGCRRSARGACVRESECERGGRERLWGRRGGLRGRGALCGRCTQPVCHRPPPPARARSLHQCMQNVHECTHAHPQVPGPVPRRGQLARGRGRARRGHCLCGGLRDGGEPVVRPPARQVHGGFGGA